MNVHGQEMNEVFITLIYVLALATTPFLSFCRADDTIPLGQEYTDYNRGASAPARKIGNKVLWYLPNRVLDLLDIVRADVGLGFGYGGVVRGTRSLQMGYRRFNPGSMRFGLRGRRAPVFLEQGVEKGFADGFRQSSARRVTRGELGVGVELGPVGAYGGVCLDELVDFVLGIAAVDLKDDDYS